MMSGSERARRRGGTGFDTPVRRPNQYAGRCAVCQTDVAALAGALHRHGNEWVIRCDACEEKANAA